MANKSVRDKQQMIGVQGWG